MKKFQKKKSFFIDRKDDEKLLKIKTQKKEYLAFPEAIIKIYRKEVIKSINLYGEMHRYIPLIAKWNGYNFIGEKIVKHNKRKFGVTKFGMERFIRGFLDLLSEPFRKKS